MTNNISESPINQQDTEKTLNPNAFLMIPAYVVLNPKVDAPTALLFGWINSLSNQEGYCWASNKYIGELTKTKIREVQYRLETLRDLDLIRISLSKNGMKWNRQIYTCNHYSQWPKDKDPDDFKKMFTTCTGMHDRDAETCTIDAHICAPEQDNKENKISDNKINDAQAHFDPPELKNHVKKDVKKSFVKEASSQMAFASKAIHFDDVELRRGFSRSGFIEDEIEDCINYFKTNVEFLSTKDNPVGYCIGIMRKKLFPQRQKKLMEEPAERYSDIKTTTGSAKEVIENLYHDLKQKEVPSPFVITDVGVEISKEGKNTFILYKKMDEYTLSWIKQTFQRLISPEMFQYKEPI